MQTFKDETEIKPSIACNLRRYQRSVLAQLRFGILPLSKKCKIEFALCSEQKMKMKHIFVKIISIFQKGKSQLICRQ